MNIKIITKIELKEDIKEQIVNILSNILSKEIKKDEVSFLIDNELIGGIKILISSKVIDLTLSNKLQRVLKKIRNV